MNACLGNIRIEPTEREADMMKMRMGGATFKAIGERYDLSPERVRQIVRKRQRIADMCEND